MAKSALERFIENNPLILAVGAASIAAVVFYEDIKSVFTAGAVTDVQVDSTQLPKTKEAYQTAADNTYSELANSLVYASSDKLLSFILGLNDEELKQVYIDFGTRADNLNLQDIGTKHDLFWWYQNEHGTNPLFDLAALKTRWAGTGLWN